MIQTTTLGKKRKEKKDGEEEVKEESAKHSTGSPPFTERKSNGQGTYRTLNL